MFEGVVLITGVPRAGTTLTVELLGQLPDCIALDEPINAERLLQGAQLPTGLRSSIRSKLGHKASASGGFDPVRVVDNVIGFCEEMRAMALDRGVVVSKHVGGVVVGSRVADDSEPGGHRRQLAQREEIPVGKPLSPQFTLFVKHNSVFAGLLPTLNQRVPVYAVVRNPLAILASWNTVSFPVSKGRAYAAERFDCQLARTLDRLSDVYARQVHLLQWFFARLHGNLGSARIVRYEDIIASEGAALDVIHPSGGTVRTSLASRNQNRIYDPKTMHELGRRLLDSDGAYWNFYDRADVLSLMPV